VKEGRTLKGGDEVKEVKEARKEGDEATRRK
jgi:hypothetical protein